jgi:signal transduction histidine kinase
VTEISVVRRPVEWLKAHPFAADVALTGLILAICLPMFLTIDLEDYPSQRDPDLIGGVLLVATVVPLAWRRVAPRLVLLATLVATVPFLILDYPDVGSTTSSLIAMYTVAAHCERRETTIAFGWSMAIMLPVLVAGVISDEENLPVAGVVGNLVIFGTAWILGDAVRNRRQLVESLQERAETAERLRAEEAQQAVLEERARIARELHDVVAHSLSVMTVQAAGARRVLDDHPGQARDALAQIEGTGREAMVEMRRLLGVLRADGHDSPDLAPQPGLDDVPTLVAKWNEAGLPVVLQITGDGVEVPPGVDLSTYRVIQEALTNVSKHAGTAARAAVRIQVGDDAVELEITDDGRGAAAAVTAGGHGLDGIRERVALVGGSVECGPADGGGWRVRAVLPLTATASAGTPA